MQASQCISLQSLEECRPFTAPKYSTTWFRTMSSNLVSSRDTRYIYIGFCHGTGKMLLEALDQHLYNYGNLSSWKGKEGPLNKSFCWIFFLPVFFLVRWILLSVPENVRSTKDRRSVPRKKIHPLKERLEMFCFDRYELCYTCQSGKLGWPKRRYIGTHVKLSSLHTERHIFQIRVIALSYKQQVNYSLNLLLPEIVFCHVSKWPDFIEKAFDCSVQVRNHVKARMHRTIINIYKT